MAGTQGQLPWLKNPNRAITVEVVIFLYIAGVILEVTVMQQYLYERARNDLKINSTDNNTICINQNDGNSSAHSSDKVQKKASQYILAVNLTLTMPAIIAACLLASWSDKRGRKPLMLIVSFGAAVDAAVVLTTMYMKWSVYVLMVAGGMAGITGYYPTMVLALLAYVADTTQPQSRAMKLGILEALAFLGGTIGQFASGFWIQQLGYKATFWGILSIHIINFVYILFFLPESMPKERIQTAYRCFSWDSIKPVFNVYLKKRRGRWILCVLCFLSVLFLLAQSVVTTLVVLYGKKFPLCWSATLIGYFLGTLLCCKAFGAVFGIWVCSLLKLSNYTAAQIGTLFLIGCLTMIGFSKTTLNMFLSCVVGLFSGVPQPCVRAQMSQMVTKEEQGALFAILASLESLSSFSSQLIFNPLYAWSIVEVHWKYAAGLPFFINAGIAVISFALLGIIKCIISKKQGEEHKPLLQEDNAQT